MNKLYCYVHHREAVCSLLESAGIDGAEVVPIERADYLRGLVGGTFVSVAGHYYVMLDEFYQLIRERGMIVLTLNDSYARARARMVAQS